MAETTDDLLTLVSRTGGTFNIDRLMFLKKSSYYKALVLSGMKDSKSKILKFGILSESSLFEVLRFFKQMNEGVINANHSLNIAAGLEAATYLQIEDMIEKYSIYLTESLDLLNWFHCLDLSLKYGLLDVKDSVLRFLCERFQLCCYKEDFLNLESEHIEFILGSDTTCADNETVIFNATCRWLLHEHSRFSLMPKIMKNIRFELMTEIELQESKTVLNSFNCETWIDKTSFFDHDVTKCLRIRCAVEIFVVLGGFTKKEFSTNRFQIISSSDLSCTLDAEMKSESLSLISFKSSKTCRLPQTLCEHGVCVVGGCLYVAGGQIHYHDSGKLTTNKVFVFNPLFQEWSSCRSMSLPRSLFYLGELDGHIYAVSGCTASNTDTHTVERYLPSQDIWTLVASLEVRVHELAGCNHCGQIYISGGFRGPSMGHVDLVWRYDPSINQWVKRAPLLKSRSYHAMIALPEKLFVLGGVRYLGNGHFEDVMDGEMYDPILDQWSKIIHLMHPASCMPSVVVGNKILLFGGHSFVQDTNHDYVQVITKRDVSKLSDENANKQLCSENLMTLREVIDHSPTDITFECQLLKFEAHGISYFSLCKINLPKKFVEQFH